MAAAALVGMFLVAVIALLVAATMMLRANGQVRRILEAYELRIQKHEEFVKALLDRQAVEGRRVAPLSEEAPTAEMRPIPKPFVSEEDEIRAAIAHADAGLAARNLPGDFSGNV